MRSIVYAGNDFSEICSAEVIERAAIPIVANAIRFQAGVGTTYKPREMADAVAALNGNNAGNCQPQDYMELESGVLPESVFSDIADAIRGQNGESTLYAPGDMAAAILALEWDVAYKIRALLLDDGTLEINYYERRTAVTGERIAQVSRSTLRDTRRLARAPTAPSSCW